MMVSKRRVVISHGERLPILAAIRASVIRPCLLPLSRTTGMRSATVMAMYIVMDQRRRHQPIKV